jgi:hypothetical protein
MPSLLGQEQLYLLPSCRVNTTDLCLTAGIQSLNYKCQSFELMYLNIRMFELLVVFFACFLPNISCNGKDVRTLFSSATCIWQITFKTLPL